MWLVLPTLRTSGDTSHPYLARSTTTPPRMGWGVVEPHR